MDIKQNQIHYKFFPIWCLITVKYNPFCIEGLRSNFSINNWIVFDLKLKFTFGQRVDPCWAFVILTWFWYVILVHHIRSHRDLHKNVALFWRVLVIIEYQCVFFFLRNAFFPWSSVYNWILSHTGNFYNKFSYVI